jgi:hypothetical protein
VTIALTVKDEVRYTQEVFGNKPSTIPCNTLFIDDYVPSAFNYPFVSCQTYVIMDPRKNKVFFGKK